MYILFFILWVILRLTLFLEGQFKLCLPLWCVQPPVDVIRRRGGGGEGGGGGGMGEEDEDEGEGEEDVGGGG